MNTQKEKTRMELNEEAINAMAWTEEEFQKYKAAEEEDYKQNKWKYICLYERAITIA